MADIAKTARLTRTGHDERSASSLLSSARTDAASWRRLHSIIEKLPGVLKVVRDGNFLAVVARREYQAIKAMRRLATVSRWEEKATLPKFSDLPSVITSLQSQDYQILNQGRAGTQASGRKLEATFTRPYQSHGSIGPSCAVAQTSEDGGVTVWTHTQGVFPDRNAIAQMLRLPPDKVRCIHTGAVDARAGAWVGALRPRNGDQSRGDR